MVFNISNIVIDVVLVDVILKSYLKMVLESTIIKNTESYKMDEEVNYAAMISLGCCCYCLLIMGVCFDQVQIPKGDEFIHEYDLLGMDGSNQVKLTEKFWFTVELLLDLRFFYPGEAVNYFLKAMSALSQTHWSSVKMINVEHVRYLLALAQN